jgi:hypothetical protein
MFIIINVINISVFIIIIIIIITIIIRVRMFIIMIMAQLVTTARGLVIIIIVNKESFAGLLDMFDSSESPLRVERQRTTFGRYMGPIEDWLGRGGSEESTKWPSPSITHVETPLNAKLFLEDDRNTNMLRCSTTCEIGRETQYVRRTQ